MAPTRRTRKNKPQKNINRTSRRSVNSKPGSRTARGSTRSTLSVNDIRNRFKDMDTSVRTFLHKNNLNNPKELGKHVSRQWTKLFNKHLSGKAASSLTNHYMNMYGKKASKSRTRKVSGGSMGAPLDYVMRPGLPAVATYATFPTEVGADPKSVQDLDVYYNSGMGRSCGYENTTAQVPPTMGSNKVGGRRRTRGGDFMAAMSARPFIAANPSTGLQQLGESWHGQAPSPYDMKDPSVSAFKLVSDGKLPIDPAGISLIDKDITKLANPSPYPAVK